VGRVVSSHSVVVRPQVTGQLMAARFSEGQVVREGALLLELDRRPFEAALAEARANLARDQARAVSARADAIRYEGLAAKEYVTRQQAEGARANAGALDATLEADRAAIERAELNLAYCSIRAPITGRTGRLLVHPGNLVTAGTQDLVTIEQQRPVLASFTLPERHLAALRAAGPGAVVLVEPASGGPASRGSVEFIDNAVDQTTGTVLVKATLPNQDEALWPGQAVQVRVKLSDRPQAVVVPSAAVAQGQQGDYVWVVKDGAAQVRQVTVEEAGEREVVVRQGIAAGEVVVTEGQMKLVPGARVEPLAATPPSVPPSAPPSAPAAPVKP
jgi:multidrug efflux system membrane fusion protein